MLDHYYAIEFIHGPVKVLTLVRFRALLIMLVH